MGYGDLTVQKEIIDSKILLSGKCNNPGGHIIASKISAKMGIEAGAVGTPASGPSTFKVGIDEHLAQLMQQTDDALAASVEKSDLIKSDIKKLEAEDQALYQQISEKAQIQDQAQVEIKGMLKELKLFKTNP